MSSSPAVKKKNKREPLYPYSLDSHEIRFAQLSKKQLRVDLAVQRDASIPHVDKMSGTNWQPMAAGTLVVNRRKNGEYYIVDGQHRWLAAPDDFLFMCEVHEGLDPSEEATLFLIKNRESKKPNPKAEWKLGLKAGLPLFLDTRDVLEKYNLSLGYPPPGEDMLVIRAISGVLAVTAQSGVEVLDKTLSTLQVAFKRDVNGFDGQLIGGMARFIVKHPEVDLAKLGWKMSLEDARRWVAAVHARASDQGLHYSGTGSRKIAAYQLILECWNKGRREENRLIAA